MPKSTADSPLEFSTSIVTGKDVPIKAPDLEFLTKRIETLTGLLSGLLYVTGQINGNAVHSKNRCYDCALMYNHDDSAMCHCPCVCHEARRYLTQLSSEG